MPKESVTPLDPEGPYTVKVGWNHGVQVGVASDSYRSLVWLLMAPEGPSQDDRCMRIGQAVEEALRVGHAQNEVFSLEAQGRAVLNALDTVQVFSGVWADLDRRGCNQLIKLIRKARDAAFGRDE